MADVIKVLGQTSTATATDLYVVPNLVQTTTSTLVVCNRTAGTLTFNVAVRPAGASVVDKHYIFYGTPIGGNSTLTATIGMTLAQSDVVTTTASATGLSFTLFGVETS